jgi:hypothetical protein
MARRTPIFDYDAKGCRAVVRDAFSALYIVAMMMVLFGVKLAVHWLFGSF